MFDAVPRLSPLLIHKRTPEAANAPSSDRARANVLNIKHPEIKANETTSHPCETLQEGKREQE